MRAILQAILLLLLVRSAQALQFFGGVTDPGLFQGQYPFSWPDTLFFQLPYNAASCQDSASSYQQLNGNDPNFKAVKTYLAWVQQNNFAAATWYAGYIASVDSSFNGLSRQDFLNYINQIAALPNAQASNLYINYANEPVHGTGNNLNNSNSQFQAAWGGRGATGYDWLINLGKAFRAAFPNAKLGINDFGFEDINFDNYQITLKVCQILQQNGVLDWVGMEGYALNGVVNADLNAALNGIGALAPIVFTEFSPDAFSPPGPANMNDWQVLLGVIVANPNVVGVIGPWTFRKSDDNADPGGWLIDDTANPASDTGTLSPAANFLKSFIPTIVSGAPSPSPSPSPAPSPSPTSTPAPQPSPTATPSPTPVGPTPTPASTPTPSTSPPLPTPTPSSSPTPTSTPSPQSTPPLQPTPTPIQAGATPTPSPTPTPAPTLSQSMSQIFALINGSTQTVSSPVPNPVPGPVAASIVSPAAMLAPASVSPTPGPISLSGTGALALPLALNPVPPIPMQLQSPQAAGPGADVMFDWVQMLFLLNASQNPNP